MTSIAGRDFTDLNPIAQTGDDLLIAAVHGTWYAPSFTPMLPMAPGCIVRVTITGNGDDANS